jgi:putative hydrolase of the HAD superfamily
VIFDYGDVISFPADPLVIARMAAKFGLSEPRFRELYGSLRLAYDRGTLGAHQYWTGIAEIAGVELSPAYIAELRKDDVVMWSRLNPSILDWADQLRSAGLKTAVLSNMHADMVEHLRANGEWTKRFDFLTLSSSVGMAKPEPEIFEYCLRGLDVSAAEALFIDDREVNVEAALQLGWNAILAPSTRQLQVKLESLGFSPLPGPSGPEPSRSAAVQ